MRNYFKYGFKLALLFCAGLFFCMSVIVSRSSYLESVALPDLHIFFSAVFFGLAVLTTSAFIIIKALDASELPAAELIVMNSEMMDYNELLSEFADVQTATMESMERSQKEFIMLIADELECRHYVLEKDDDDSEQEV